MAQPANLPHQRQSGSKTGRRGDPRMHKAVAARIADPDLTLYEALKAGGFLYPTDDDSGCVDSEQVSLGQRKNQLSRRIRLAKKNGGVGEHLPVPLENPSQPQLDMNPLLSSNVGVLHHPRGPRNQQQLSGNKHALLDDECLSGDAEEDCQDESPQPTMMAKFHPQYHPDRCPHQPGQFRRTVAQP